MAGNKGVDQRVGKQMRALRLAAGMSTESLASALGMLSGQVEEWEAGLSRVPPPILIQISNILGINAALFFESEDRPIVEVPLDDINEKAALLRKGEQQFDVAKPEDKSDI